MSATPASAIPGPPAGSGPGPSPGPAPDTFTHRFIPAFGKRVHRLGLAGNYGIDESGVRAALASGLNYVFCPPQSKSLLVQPVREAIQRDRESMVVACGPSFGYFGGLVRRGVDKARKLLGTDYLDLYQLFWLGKTSAWTESTMGELVKIRASGAARCIGVSIHDRIRAGKLAEDSPLDALMIRYNASHPGAERDIFPHMVKRRPVVIAYTATDWRKLLTRPSGWTGPVPTAGDCYRFCLSSPHVDIVVHGPGSRQQLDENLAALARGPLDPDEMKWMREFGKVIYGKGIVNQG